MRILALDTATAATAVGLFDTATGTAVARRDDPPAGARPRHTARLLSLVAQAMSAAGCGWEDIDRIAVGVGPGTFTGLRIGIATAQALARTREIELVGVSTLQSLASAAAADAGDADGVLAVIDARRREVFAAGWVPAQASEAEAEPLIAPAPRSPAELAQTLSADGRRWVAVGDGAVGFQEVLEHGGVRTLDGDSDRNRVDAVQHCRLAVALTPEGPGAVRPSYLRLPDAEISRQARQI